MNRTLLSAALALASLPLAACLAAHSTEALVVDASISSVTLAEDCGGAGLVSGERCDSDVPCPSLCQQSSLQLHLDASDEGAAVPFEIVSIRVIDPETGGSTSIVSRSPRVFVDGYTAWDETIAPGDLLDVAYDTTAPDWSAAGAGADGFRWGHVYRVEVVVRIDGVERTLTADAMREPEIAT